MRKINKKAFSSTEISIIFVIISLFIAGIGTGDKMISLSRINVAESTTTSSPTNNIENLVMWLETTSKNSFIDEERISGTEITKWYDINPQSTTKCNAIAKNGPIYVEGKLNDLPAIEFDGIDDYFLINDTILDPSTTNFSIFIVAKFNNTSNNSSIISKADGNGTGRVFLGKNYENNIQSLLGGTTTTGSIVSFSPQIYNINNNSGALTIYKDGLPDVSGTRSIEYTNGQFIIGANEDLMEDFMDGYIGEIIIYDKLLSDFEIQEIENYLSKK